MERSINHPPIKYCREPSSTYLQLLEECGEDPRSAAGVHALRRASALARRGWVPDYDARDTRKR